MADSSGTTIGPTITSNISLIGWVSVVMPVEVNVDIVLPTTTIDPTNRMIVRLYLSNNDATAHSVVYYTEGNSYYSFVVTSVGAIAGTSGTSGTNGTSGTSVSVPGLNNEVLTSDGSGGIVAESNMTFDGSQLSVTGTVVTHGFALPNIDTSTGYLTTSTPMVTSTSIDWLSRIAYDVSSTSSINWTSRYLTDSYPSTSVDWETKYLNAYDLFTSGSTLSVDWDNRSLYSFSPLPMPTSVLSVDWQNRDLYDSNGASSLSWRGRELVNPIGITGLSWKGQTFLTSDVYQRDYKSEVTQDAVSTNYNNPYTSYLGDIIESDGIVTYIDSSVTEGMLVYLYLGVWAPVDQSSIRSTYLLGIAHNLVPAPPNLSGWILLEGHVVIDDTSTSGPYVASAGYGRPIYIEDSTTTGTMSTIIPTTASGTNIVRLLGHCYQQNSSTTTQWMMKFRPSNDWIEI